MKKKHLPLVIQDMNNRSRREKPIVNNTKIVIIDNKSVKKIFNFYKYIRTILIQ